MAHQRLIFGCGYLGARVARRWRDAGDRVHTVTRSEERAAQLAAQGYVPLVADVAEPDSLAELPRADTVLFAVGFDRSSGRRIEEVCVDGVRNVIEHLLPGTGRFIYISSTGVYGTAGGDWVDEQTVCQPTRDGGRACLAAEQLLQQSPLADRTVVLRLAGIYGPDRLPLAEKLRQGEPLPGGGDNYLNLIHVEDAADIVIQVTQTPSPASCYCVCDGHPVLRRDFYRTLADLLGTPEPRFAAASTEDNKRRGGSNKRVSNRRLMRELNPQLQMPTYREGLAAICQ